MSETLLVVGKHYLPNLGATQELAEKMAQELRGGDILLLSGPLGSGKTTFVKALARALGVKDKVNSPSYTIVGEYAVPSHEAIKRLVHVDLYRLEKNPAEDPAVKDFLDQAGNSDRLTVVEWAERLGPVKSLRDHGVKITFDYGESVDERLVTIDR